MIDLCPQGAQFGLDAGKFDRFGPPPDGLGLDVAHRQHNRGQRQSRYRRTREQRHCRASLVGPRPRHHIASGQVYRAAHPQDGQQGKAAFTQQFRAHAGDGPRPGGQEAGQVFRVIPDEHHLRRDLADTQPTAFPPCSEQVRSTDGDKVLRGTDDECDETEAQSNPPAAQPTPGHHDQQPQKGPVRAKDQPVIIDEQDLDCRQRPEQFEPVPFLECSLVTDDAFEQRAAAQEIDERDGQD